MLRWSLLLTVDRMYVCPVLQSECLFVWTACWLVFLVLNCSLLWLAKVFWLLSTRHDRNHPWHRTVMYVDEMFTRLGGRVCGKFWLVLMSCLCLEKNDEMAAGWPGRTWQLADPEEYGSWLTRGNMAAGWLRATWQLAYPGEWLSCVCCWLLLNDYISKIMLRNLWKQQ